MGTSKGITKVDIVNAIDEIRNKGYQSIESVDYYIEFDDFLYPTKQIISIVNRNARQQNLDPNDNDNVNAVFTDLGFSVVTKPSESGGTKWLVVTTR
jgi:hypothetical protein